MTGRYPASPQAWEERRAEVGAAARRAIAARAGLAVCCYEPRCGHSCPLCTDGYHPRCVIPAGSLACVASPCGNPHHRATTASHNRRDLAGG